MFSSIVRKINPVLKALGTLVFISNILKLKEPIPDPELKVA